MRLIIFYQSFLFVQQNVIKMISSKFYLYYKIYIVNTKINGGFIMDNKQLNSLQTEMDILNRKIEKLNKNIVKATRGSTISAVIGAVITTIFSSFSMLYAAVISFAVTLIIVFAIDLVKKVLTVLFWKSNNLRNKFIVSGVSKKS